MQIDVKSDVSCYVKIGEYTFYLEVSSATENKPYVTHWHGEMTKKEKTIEHANLECDFCKILIENDGEGSAFTDGSAFSNVGVDDRIACPKCAFYLKQEDL